MLTANPHWGPPPSGIDLQQELTTRVVIVHSILLVLSTLIVVLRFFSRRLTGTSLWWDDWFILAALLVNFVWRFAMVPYMTHHGLGKHIWVTQQDSLYAVSKGSFIEEVAYPLVLCCIKCSIAMLLLRLFKPSGIAKKVYVIIGTLTVWGVAFALVELFQCIPVGSSFNRWLSSPPASPTCKMVDMSWSIGFTVPSIVYDVILIVMPLPYIWHIQVSRARRLALMGIFSVGIFVTVVSIVRLWLVSHSKADSIDFTFELAYLYIWTIVELDIAIICACMPLLRPYFNIVIFGKVNAAGFSNHANRSAPFTRGRTKPAQSTVRTQSEDRQDLFYKRPQNDPDQTTKTRIERHYTVPKFELHNMRDDAGIRVQTDILVGHHQKREDQVSTDEV